MARNRGFTLIELLVVIAIIGLLSSVVLASLRSAREKAQDSERVRNLTTLRTALELYRNSTGAYPVSTAWSSHCSAFGGWPLTGATGWIPNLAPTYIAELPTDPSTNGSSVYCYLYRSDASGGSFKLLSYNLPNTDVSSVFSLMDPARNYGMTRPSGCPSTVNVARTWAVWSDDVTKCY